MPPNLTNQIITAAIEGYNVQKTRINARIAELRNLLNGSSTKSPAKTEPAPQKRRKLSAGARRKIALAQKARWAKMREESEPNGREPEKPKRRISPEGLKRIIATTKKRWRLKKAADKAKAAAKTKKAAPARKKTAVKKAAIKAAPAKATKRSAPASKATAVSAPATDTPQPAV
jgi:hypothetical protein